MTRRIFPIVGACAYCAVALLMWPAPITAAFAADPAGTAPNEAAAASIPGNACLGDRRQITRVTAQKLMVACSDALQSHRLTPADVALARLNRGTARMALGDSIMANADYEEAIKHYDSVIDPKDPDALALYRRGAAQEAVGRTERALSDYDEAIRVNPKDPLAFLARGVLLASRKRLYDRAISDFDKVLDLASGNVEALMRRGDAYSQMGNFGPALADLDRAVALDPDNAEIYVYRGIANSRRNDNKLAMLDYTSALARDPANVDALVNRAAIYSTNGEQVLAIADLDAAIALKTSDPMAFYNRGYAHFANRQYNMAIADYTAAIGLDPKMGLAYTNRCLTAAIVGKDLVAALADCDVALKLMPSDADVRDTRAFVYLKMGEPEIAITEYTAALAIKPDRALSLYGRGLARIKAGHAKEGAADRAASLALNPDIARQFSMFGLE